MNSKILFLAVFLFLLILNFAGYANKRCEEQIYEVSDLGVSPTSLKWFKKAHTEVFLSKNDDERPTCNPIYANKKIAFRHLMLSHSHSNPFSWISQGAGDPKL